MTGRKPAAHCRARRSGIPRSPIRQIPFHSRLRDRPRRWSRLSHARRSRFQNSRAVSKSQSVCPLPVDTARSIPSMLPEMRTPGIILTAATTPRCCCAASGVLPRRKPLLHAIGQAKSDKAVTPMQPEIRVLAIHGSPEYDLPRPASDASRHILLPDG